MNRRRIGPFLHAAAGWFGRRVCVTSPPIHIQIEASSRCNFRCGYCVRGAAAAEPEGSLRGAVPDHGMIRPADLATMMEKIRAEAPAAALNLAVGGEPLLHPGITDLIALCNRFGYAVGFSTNGSRLIESLSRELIRSDLRYGLLVDFTADRATYEGARAGGSWEQVLGNLRRYLELSAEFGKTPALALKEMGDAAGGASTPAERSARMRALRALFPTLPEGRFHILERHNWTGEVGVARRGRYSRCTHPWFAMAVNVRGEVLACCRDLRERHVVGSLRDARSVLAVWNSRRMQALRRALIERRPEAIAPCRECDRPYRAGLVGGPVARQIRLVRQYLRRY